MFVGIDVGGANTKVVTSEGFVDSIYAPLWKDKTILYNLLSEYKFASEIEAVGAVMTGELCDCFETKREGVLHIKDALSTAFREVKFFNADCAFKDSTDVDKYPLSFASTNWLASSKLISEQYEDAIFVDVGSTTTDVIPIVGGEIKARQTDLERLKNGELIYSGVQRTNVAALLKSVEIGEECSVSSELFAITADAYLVLGHITEDDYSCESPDSYAFVNRDEAEKSRVSAMRRLARVVCSDLEEIGEDNAVHIATQVKRAQVDDLFASMKRIKEKYRLEMIVSAGIGDFIVKEAADLLNIQFISLSSRYGKRIAATFPAYSVAKLLENFLN
ncbi:MAG TPA: H4MPT-linked C1 transfer pathway protein [Methanophagales archaeon]|nr:H4MPT-linked C1 transfer pathway protein [Methanophagales archaeon]